jgi:hypothetical protein
MTIKHVYVNDSGNKSIGYCTITETYGGQQLQINITGQLYEIMDWWVEWGPIFKSKDPTVMDTLRQAKVLHDVTK